MKDLRIVFMGTPDFAVATLGAMLMNGLNVVAVVTAPDRPSGRGQKVSMSPVKVFAESSKLTVLQPEKLKEETFIKKLIELRADLFVVVAFRMLPSEIWKMPPLGTINLHASLLPSYRGAAPINHALINGESHTGLTTFFINEKIDSGSILLREKVKIFPSENAGDLHDRLMKLGARLVIKTIRGLAAGRLMAVPQDEVGSHAENLPEAPKIFPESCYISWNKEPGTIYNFIRGLSPSPCARTRILCEGKEILLKIFECAAVEENHELKPGTLLSDGKAFIRVACMNGFIDILNLQAEGRKRMNVRDFLNGFSLESCERELT